MNVLVACEFSGVVREAFRRRGHDAFSCDILPSDDVSASHYREDVIELLWESGNRFDLVIAHPPCTHLSSSGARWFKEKIADGRQQEGIDFFMRIVNICTNKKIPYCIENPVGVMSTKFRKPDQIIQPWQFGHGETKATCLWLKGLPKLEPTNIVTGREARIHNLPPSADRGKLRSITYQGIADAMAEQWG